MYAPDRGRSNVLHWEPFKPTFLPLTEKTLVCLSLVTKEEQDANDEIPDNTHFHAWTSVSLERCCCWSFWNRCWQTQWRTARCGSWLRLHVALPGSCSYPKVPSGPSRRSGGLFTRTEVRALSTGVIESLSGGVYTRSWPGWWAPAAAWRRAPRFWFHSCRPGNIAGPFLLLYSFRPVTRSLQMHSPQDTFRMMKNKSSSFKPAWRVWGSDCRVFVLLVLLLDWCPCHRL